MYVLSGLATVATSTSIPFLTFVISPSATSALINILDKSATCTIVGADWLLFTVCPSDTGIDITTPSIGEVIDVYDKFVSAVFTDIDACAINSSYSVTLAFATSNSSFAVS